MALSKVKKIGNIQRPINTARNRFNEADNYDQSHTISPEGRDPDSSGQVGTSIDIVQRKTNVTRNLFTPNNQYSVDD